MKKIVLEFIRKGMVACGLGPIVLGVVYLILEHQGMIQMLTVSQVCREIFSLAALGFAVGGMNVIYQIERLPLMLAILIHGIVLYVSYLGTYLFNDWLPQGLGPILGFTAIFIFAYFLTWVVIYSVTRNRTEKLNAVLKKNRNETA